MAAKTSPPPYVRSGAATTGVPEELDRSDAAGTGAPGRLSTGGLEKLGARAPEELVPDDLLLQKDQDQSQNKEEGFSSRKKTTHHRMIRGASSSSSSSVSTKATIAPAEKGQKYSVKDKNKQQKDRAY